LQAGTEPNFPIVESDYEVKLPIFEGPLDLLLYLVQKNELNPREIQISVITDQYLGWMDTIHRMNLSNAGEFLVMAARLMRLKARELLPQDQKSDLEEMEYELDRQALILQMLEYQKFKEAARSLRSFENNHFGAFGHGRIEIPGQNDKGEFEEEEEAGIFDLLSAFRNVMLQKPRLPVHEVEIDDVTIEDRMQEVEIMLIERGRCLFEDLFEHDNRRIAKVVTFMSILELCKTDVIVLRQAHGLGVIRVYRKKDNAAFDMELSLPEQNQLESLPEFRPGLVDIIKQQMAARTVRNALEDAIKEIEAELRGETVAPAETIEVEDGATPTPQKSQRGKAKKEQTTEASLTSSSISDGVAAKAAGGEIVPPTANHITGYYAASEVDEEEWTDDDIATDSASLHNAPLHSAPPTPEDLKAENEIALAAARQIAEATEDAAPTDLVTGWEEEDA